MVWRERTYDVEMRRAIDPATLAAPDEAELEEADASGQLAGNGMYQDLSGFDINALRETLAAEMLAIERLTSADDLNLAAERFDDERCELSSGDPLWGLDVGVASATVALSVLGTTPVASCAAGGFGGVHQAGHPYVAAFVPAEIANDLTGMAEGAQVGAVVGDDGLVRIYGASDLALMRFARFVYQSRAISA